MNLDDTIVAIATPLGRAGIGVIRLSGPESRSIVEPMLCLKHSLQASRAVFGELVEPCGPNLYGAEIPVRQRPAETNTFVRSRPSALPETSGSAGSERTRMSTLHRNTPDEQRIDEVVVTFFQKPHSYTTDDIVEISAHGSPVVLRHIVELCLARGARLAEPGEFTMRAFLNGRLDLTQAEAVRDLIDSQTLYQAKVAAQQLDGSLSKRLQPIKQKLVELIALLEAGIDFADDDVSIAPDATILERIASVRERLDQLATSFAYGKLVHEGLTLAIVGRPNVGKSSLFNRLVERERAIVTSQPGTTRDLVTETVAIDGIPVILVDTAGIRRALDEAESIGIKKSMEALADADLVLVVLDSTQPISEEDRELLGQVQGRAAIIVKNKCDLASSQVAAGSLQASKQEAGLPAVRTSAITGDGIPELRASILQQVGGEPGTQIESGFLTNVRHQKLVNDSIRALEAATNAITARVPHEMLLLDLYGALRPLDEITGATTADDILNLIFGTFCIGK